MDFHQKCVQSYNRVIDGPYLEFFSHYLVKVSEGIRAVPRKDLGAFLDML
jgi:hypothetical protein